MPPKMSSRARLAFLGCRLGEAVLQLRSCETDHLRLESMQRVVAETQKGINELRSKVESGKLEKYDRLQQEAASWMTCEELLNFPVYGQEKKACQTVREQLLASDFAGISENDERFADKKEKQAALYGSMDADKLLKFVGDKKDQAQIKLDTLCKSDPVLNEIYRDTTTCEVLRERSYQIVMSYQDAKTEKETREAAFRDCVLKYNPEANADEAVEQLIKSMENMTPAKLREQRLHMFKTVAAKSVTPEGMAPDMEPGMEKAVSDPEKEKEAPEKTLPDRMAGPQL